MFGKKSPAPTLPALDSEGLLLLVQSGNVAAIRRYFDQSVTGSTAVTPSWVHLEAALVRNDMPMMRFLITWGARPDADCAAQLTDVQIKRLRIAGLVLNEMPRHFTEMAQASIKNDKPLKEAVTATKQQLPSHILLPSEWSKVLQAFQEVAKAPEAMIVGGALRDLHNKKPVSDIDIFLRMPLWPGQEQNTLKRAFKKAGLEIHMQEERRVETYGGVIVERPRLFTRQGDASPFVYRDMGLGVTSAWVAVAGPDRTKYNIIFIDSPLMDYLRRKAKENPHDEKPIQDYIRRLDIGICQIAHRGNRRIHISAAYEDDVIHKKLTLVNPQQTTYDHAMRVVEKYRDHKPDAKLVEITKPRNDANTSARRQSSPYSMMPPG